MFTRSNARALGYRYSWRLKGNTFMGSGEKIVALVVALACIVMLIRLALGSRRTASFDRALRNGWSSVQRRASRTWLHIWHRKKAKQATEEVLQRLRRPPAERNGNVISPHAFKKPNESQRRSQRSDDEV
ncbi:MAG TPA: hypothetical protein VFM48_15150 [Aquabacterium sp.]|nr:hypothetical protein [Aquabacterium sp.]